jgi:hypothetical protein
LNRSRDRGELSVLFTPFQPWTLVGPTLIIYLAGTRQLSVRMAILIVSLGAGLTIWQGLEIARFGPRDGVRAGPLLRGNPGRPYSPEMAWCSHVEHWSLWQVSKN